MLCKLKTFHHVVWGTILVNMHYKMLMKLSRKGYHEAHSSHPRRDGDKTMTWHNKTVAITDTKKGAKETHYTIKVVKNSQQIELQSSEHHPNNVNHIYGRVFHGKTPSLKKAMSRRAGGRRASSEVYLLFFFYFFFFQICYHNSSLEKPVYNAVRRISCYYIL